MLQNYKKQLCPVLRLLTAQHLLANFLTQEAPPTLRCCLLVSLPNFSIPKAGSRLLMSSTLKASTYTFFFACPLIDILLMTWANNMESQRSRLCLGCQTITKREHGRSRVLQKCSRPQPLLCILLFSSKIFMLHRASKHIKSQAMSWALCAFDMICSFYLFDDVLVVRYMDDDNQR